jgi:hypothetical protein
MFCSRTFVTFRDSQAALFRFYLQMSAARCASWVALLMLSPCVLAQNDSGWGNSGRDYSGEGSWYLGLSVESAMVDQNLTQDDQLQAVYPRLKVGGTGPQQARFEISWSRLETNSGSWRTSGLDGDVWLPYQPERRIRPYLLLGMGYHRFYGNNTEFFDETGADNGARSLNAGLAVVGNLTQTTELVATFRYRYLTWDAPDNDQGESVSGANATITSVSFGVQQLF